MEEANKLLGAAINASANATQTGIEQAKSVMANVTNNVSNATSNTTRAAMNGANATANASANATGEGLKKYENDTLGISFQYPSNWREEINEFPFMEGRLHYLRFFITVPKLDTVNTTSSNASEWNTPNIISSNASACAGNEPKGSMGVILLGVLKKCEVYEMSVVPIELDKPSIDKTPCNCNVLKDFVAWDYTGGNNENRTFINDNQTIIGNNYTAWQTETEYKSGDRLLTVYAINGNVGYKFVYDAPADIRFDRYLDGFKNMLKTITLTPPIPEKKPSFLNSSDTTDTSILPSTPTVQDKSFKILSSNDFIDSIGYLHVVGEVENNTPTNAQFVKITATFYDTNDQVVATDFTYTNPSDIGSGQKAPFELLLMSASIPVSQIHHYNLQASYQ